MPLQSNTNLLEKLKVTESTIRLLQAKNNEDSARTADYEEQLKVLREGMNELMTVRAEVGLIDVHHEVVITL